MFSTSRATFSPPIGNPPRGSATNSWASPSVKTSGTTKTFWANRRYDRDPVTEIIAQGTTILLNISASPYTIDKRGLRLEMLRSIAMHHRRPIVYVNQVGGDDSLIFDGASMALTADGRVAAQARAFEEDLVFFDTRHRQRRNPRSASRRNRLRLSGDLSLARTTTCRNVDSRKSSSDSAAELIPPSLPPLPWRPWDPKTFSASPCPAHYSSRAARPTPPSWPKISAST